jgi:sarcosine/dimethylglycine N-methyltransferase
MAGLDVHYSAHNIEERILAAIRASGLSSEQRLSPEALGALDHFHTGGRRATIELLELAKIRKQDRVLDLGAGLAGPARMLVSMTGCRVVCLDTSHDYCTGAALLNRLTGLDDRIEVREGSALDMPFADASFEAVWMQNVGMSIPDKRRLYTEIRRVLKPGGRFAFQDVAAGKTGQLYFPVTWALEPAENFLVPAEDICAGLEASGFITEVFEDSSDAELARPPAGAAQGPLTMAVYVDNLAEKVRNNRRSLEEGSIRLVRGVFEAS